MRVQRIRYLLFLVLALFTLNSVAGAVGACGAHQAKQSHAPLQSSAGDDQQPCGGPDAANFCVEHYVQGSQSVDQKASADLPTLVYAPPYRVVRVLVPPARITPHLAESRPLFGPSLTILFGHLLV